jgi:UDP-N-acetylmuramate-alanine ligase
MNKMIKKILKNKKIIFITGDAKKETGVFVHFVLQKSFKIFVTDKIPTFFNVFSLLTKDVIIISDNETENIEKVKSFLNDISCYFVITQTKKKSRLKKILQKNAGNFIFVLDFSVAKKLKKKKELLSFGINKKNADFYITDIHQKENETNFKVNYKGNTIPFWIKEKLKQKEIYAVLPALCITKLFKINLADVSHRIKEEFFTQR